MTDTELRDVAQETLQAAVLDRYVARVAIIQLPALIGFEQRGISTSTALLEVLGHHVRAAALASHMLRSAFHPDDIAESCKRVDMIAGKMSISRTAMLADQLSFVLLRVLLECDRAVTTSRAVPPMPSLGTVRVASPADHPVGDDQS